MPSFFRAGCGEGGFNEVRYPDRARPALRDFPLVGLHPDAPLRPWDRAVRRRTGQFWPYPDLLFERTNVTSERPETVRASSFSTSMCLFGPPAQCSSLPATLPPKQPWFGTRIPR